MSLTQQKINDLDPKQAEQLRELLDEVICELEAMERLVRRNFPDFTHPLLAKLRAVKGGAA